MNNDAMNRAVAMLCGYTVRLWEDAVPGVAILGRVGDYVLCGPSGKAVRSRPGSEESCWRDAPNYCQNRNAIPELWQDLCKSGDFLKFIRILFPNGSDWDWFHAVKMTFDVTPKEFTEAALRATVRWQE